jgi:hypothetical protein
MHRNRIVAICLLPTLVAAASCSDTALDTAPIGELNSVTFYQTEKEFEAASLSPYSTILNLYYNQDGSGVFFSLILPDDDVRTSHAGGGGGDVETFNWRPDIGTFRNVWNESYKGIMRANVILDRLPAATRFADEKQKPRFEAEAKFLRAYFYFTLAHEFGNVPLVTAPIANVADATVGNSEPGKVWDLIEADLEFASNNLPASWDAKNKGRVTKYAALALLGKARLYRAQSFKDATKYQGAIKALSDVVASGQYKLMPNYGDNFIETQENNAESVFEVQMSRGDFNPWLPTDFPGNVGAAGTARAVVTAASCGPTNACAPGSNSYGYGHLHATLPLQAEFEADDPRRALTIFKAGDPYGDTKTTYLAAWSVTGSTPAKYLAQFNASGFPPNISTNNERIIRYADVLLLLAEAKLLGSNDVAGAAELVNQVRARARTTYQIVKGSPAPSTLLPNVPASGTPQTWFRQHLMHERRVELALELQRYADLVRWHRAGLINIKTEIDFGNTLANQNWKETYLLKPIPQGELDLNPNLKQNAGY